MQIGIRAASLGEDLRQVAPLARTCGYRGLQLDMRLGTLNVSELSASGQREVRTIVARHELELVSLRVQLGAESLVSSAGLDRVIWLLQKAVNAAVGLGVKLLCVDVGRLPSAGEAMPPRKPIAPLQAGLIIIPGMQAFTEPKGDQEPPADAGQWAPVEAVLREAGTLADRASLVLAMSSELSSFASLKYAMEQTACPWFGVDLDAVSLLRDQWDAERVLDAVGPLVRHVRARDALKGNAGRTQPAAIGQGTTRWPELLSMLDAGGYAGWFTVDTVDLPDRLGAAQRAIGML
jgi:sugar phosphate isomerase/epimerase